MRDLGRDPRTSLPARDRKTNLTSPAARLLNTDLYRTMKAADAVVSH